MSQDPNIYSPSQRGSYPLPQGSYPLPQGSYPLPQGSYPPPQGSYPSYVSPQPIRLEPYPSQPTIYAQYPSQPDGKQSPPYVDPTAAPGYDQHQISFQPPPVTPNASFPKDEGQDGTWGNFNGLEGKEIRRAFIRKVYFILMLQLLVTFGIIAIFHYTSAIVTYVKSPGGQWAYWTSYAVFLVTYLALACCKNAGRRFPINLILMILLTLSMSYMMGMISAFYTIESVFLAVGITCFVCLGITLFSFQTKYDFTSCFGILFAISLALIGFGFVCIFTYSKILYTVYAGLGAVAFSIFLAIDTQLIIGGKRHEISAEDHVFASIMLYLDVVYIFMYILMLIGKRE